MPNRIRELREELHMTQIRLSIELEVAQETVSAYENEKHYPSFAQLVRLSNLFNASIDYIMGLSDVKKPLNLPYDVTHAQNYEEMQLLSLCRELSSPQVKQVFAYIQGLQDAAKIPSSRRK